MLETGFVTHSEYQKHIRGEWRTVHDLWRHIRNYMASYAQPGGFTQGSIAFASATGFLTEDNPNFFYDAVNIRWGYGTTTPDVTIDVEFPTVETVVSRISAETRPWRHWECISGDWGYAFGIHADDKMFHIHYDTPIGNETHGMIHLDGDNVRVGILEEAPAYPFDVGGNTRIQGTFLATGAATLQGTLGVTGILTASSGITTPLDIVGGGDQLIRFTGARAAGKSAITYQDAGDGQRLILQVDQNQDIVELLNRAANGTVEIHANTAVAGVGGDVLVAEFQDDIINLSVDLAIRSQKELRFYDNGNYVGFKAPALAADQIWALPVEDGNNLDFLQTDGAGNLSWAPGGGGAGDVTAAANLTDHAIVRGNGGVKGVQDSGVIIDDTDNVTGMVTLTLPNEGLHILDTGGDHDLIIKPGTDLGADRILTLTTGDAARTITLSGNPTLGDWFDQPVKQASSPTFVNITDAGTSATNMAAGTIGQRPGGTVGDIRYNSTLGEFELYIAAWHNIARSGANVSFGTIGCGTITVANGSSINLQEDITFLGATTENLIKFPDNLPDALSFMEGANPYQTFITSNGSEAIQFHEDVLLKGSTEYGVGNKTTGAWDKTIGGGGDYADWATMIADMPDLIAHQVVVGIVVGTTLAELCELKNKHALTSAGNIQVIAAKYLPVAGSPPTADSATATTLRDVSEFDTNDEYNDCWVLIVDGTGSDDNGYVQITDTLAASGDIVVANWPGTQPDGTSKYIIVGALIDGGAARETGMEIFNSSVPIQLYGIGVKNTTENGFRIYGLTALSRMFACGAFDIPFAGITLNYCSRFEVTQSGIVLCNTANHALHGGIVVNSSAYVSVESSCLSDNLQRAILGRAGSFLYVNANSGDANGAWGTELTERSRADFVGTECSGTSGDHKYADGNFQDLEVIGIETKPGQPSFLANNTVSDPNATGDGFAFTLEFNDEIYDQDGNFATPNFTAPIDGRYTFKCLVLAENVVGNDGLLKLVTSNRTYWSNTINPTSVKTAGGDVGFIYSMDADMDEGDTAYMQIIISGGARTVRIAGHATLMRTCFSGALIC